MTEHQLNIRVYYEDTDAGGIVYHASYLRFAERARTEMLRDEGFAHASLLEDRGMGFAVVAINIEYKAPATLDDLLTVKSKIARVGGSSMEMQQNIYKGDKLTTELKVTLVCIDRTLKAVRLPPEIKQIFEKA